MIRVTLLAMIAALCPGQTLPDLGLFVHFDTKPSAAFVSSMQTELDSILAPSELEIRWLPEDQPHASRTWLRAVFIRFHGSCSATAQRDDAAKTTYVTLAETAVSGNTVLPYTDTDCDRLRAFLADGDEEQLGIAMARVLAHELYHVLLQTTAHSKEGIARAAHTPEALLGQSLRFEGDEIERIRRRYSLAQKTSFKAN